LATIKQQYIDELNQIASRYGMLEDTTIRRMLTMLKRLRSQIAGEMTAVETWDDFRRQQLERGIQRLIDGFERDLQGEIVSSVQQATEYGGQSVTGPMRAAGLGVGFFQPSRALVNTLVDFSARLVKDIADRTRRQIDQQIRLAALGQKGAAQAMADVTKTLGVDARTGVWKARPDPVSGIAARAETIVRTEMQRAYNLSTYAQQQESAKRIPGLTKSWIATADARTRESHLRAHLRYKDNPIPIDEPFRVGGADLMYPGDPNGPPGETINCRCRSVTHHPAIGRVGSSLDGRIAATLQRRTT